MARTGIVYADIARAAAALLDEGKAITVDSMREALGHTGSKSTIAPLLKRWRTDHQAQAEQAGLGLPSEFVQGMQSVYSTLQANVGMKLQEAEQAFLREREAHAAELQALQARMAEQESVLQAKQDELGQALVQIQTLTGTCHSQEVALADLGSQKTGLEERLGEQTELTQSLWRQISEVRAQFDHYQEATVVQRATERQSFEQQLTGLEHELGVARQNLLTQQLSLGQYQSQVQALIAEKAALEAAVAASQVAIQGAQRDHASVSKELEIRTQQYRAELVLATDRCQQLADREARAQREIAHLLEERIQLLQERGLLQGQIMGLQEGLRREGDSSSQ